MLESILVREAPKRTWHVLGRSRTLKGSVSAGVPKQLGLDEQLGCAKDALALYFYLSSGVVLLRSCFKKFS